jgi:Holliday junction resolvase-like predicted endonuclease
LKTSDFSSQTQTELGQLGETAATRLAVTFGWHCIEKRWRRAGQGELDLVLWDPATQTLIFAEVKTRTYRAGSALDALTKAKQAKLLMAAQQLMAQLDTKVYPVKAFRFDWFVAHPPLDPTCGQWQVTHWPNILQADSF